MNQRIFIVTGKGGVGKSVVAMAMAQRLASEGQKTLLVELGDHSYFGLAYGFEAHYEPQPLAPNLFHSLWAGETCLREYIRHLIPVRAVADLFFDNKVMRSFVRAAPGLKELAILGKLTSGVRQWGPPLPFQNVILDGYATGHFLSLLRAPKGLSELIHRGPMGTESRRIVEVLNDSRFTRYHVVSLPEEMPATESLELCIALKQVTGLTPDLICNKFYEFNPALSAELQSTSPIEDELNFASYMRNMEHSQIVALKKLRGHGQVTTLPFVLRSDSRTVVDELRLKVSTTWA